MEPFTNGVLYGAGAYVGKKSADAIDSKLDDVRQQDKCYIHDDGSMTCQVERRW